MNEVTEDDFYRAEILMAAYCGLCTVALGMAFLLAFFGDEFANIF